MTTSARPGLVAVTGASGFIGRHLVAALAERGYRVRALARRTTQSGEGLVESRNLPDVVGADWDAALGGVDAVIHLAALAHRGDPRSEAEKARVRAVNVDAPAALARAAHKVGVRRLILVSSIGVLGANSAALRFDAASLPAPHDFYSRTKLEAEQAIAACPIASCIVRPPLVFGPGAPGNFGRLLRWIRGGVPLPLAAVDNRRSLVSLWNLSDFLIACLEGSGAVGAPLLVADDEAISTPELIRAIARLLGRPARLFALPLPILRAACAAIGRTAEFERLTGSLIVDTAQSKGRTGWRPPLTLMEGLARTIAPVPGGSASP